MKKALFLDRDGILNVDKTYVYKIEDIEWMDGIIDLIKLSNLKGYLVIVLTNQSGIERGYYTDQDVLNLHKEMSNYLEKNGAIVDDWFYCPSLNSEDRKPNPGMLLKAQVKHQISLDESIMLGDKESDALNLKGPKYFLLRGSYKIDIDSAITQRDDVQIIESVKEIFKYLS